MGCYSRGVHIPAGRTQRCCEQGVEFQSGANSADAATDQRYDDPERAYKVLIADLIGMRFDDDGDPDFSEAKAHIEAKDGVFHVGLQSAKVNLEKGKIHFFYEPGLSTEQELIGAI